MMTDKMMLDVLLHASKQYIDSILKGYGTTNKELASFEKNNMARYSGDAPIDHVLFRRFLRIFDPDDIKNGIASELAKEIEAIEENTKQTESALSNHIQDFDNFRKDIRTINVVVNGKYGINSIPILITTQRGQQGDTFNYTVFGKSLLCSNDDTVNNKNLFVNGEVIGKTLVLPISNPTEVGAVVDDKILFVPLGDVIEQALHLSYGSVVNKTLNI
jgi:hypothetical protein